jgi:hypothetical protein
VDVLRERGHPVVPISRSGGVDVFTGKGLAQALTGVDGIVDAASTPTPDQAAATGFFTTSARNLQDAGRRAGVKRIVAVSIIGIERFTAGYQAAKLAHEKALRAGPIPVQILRAAQFHEFVPVLLDWGRQGDVSYLPDMRTQLVAARTVAEALADLVTRPGGASAPESYGAAIPEIAGPREERLLDAAKRYAARHGDAVRIQGARNPADPDAALYETNALLPGPNATLAGPTFEEWLATAQ